MTTAPKSLGHRTDAELEALFGDMYSGWERGVNVTQERFGDGETRFTEAPMTELELAARFVAAEIGVNIHEIANKAAFAPIIVYSQIQARLGPLFARLSATTSARDVREACKRAVTELDCMYLNGERVPYGGTPADPESSMYRIAIQEAEAAIDALNLDAAAPAAEALNATESEAESASAWLQKAIEAAKNSNQAGENAVVEAARSIGWKLR